MTDYYTRSINALLEMFNNMGMLEDETLRTQSGEIQRWVTKIINEVGDYKTRTGIYGLIDAVTATKRDLRIKGTRSSRLGLRLANIDYRGELGVSLHENVTPDTASYDNYKTAVSELQKKVRVILNLINEGPAGFADFETVAKVLKVLLGYASGLPFSTLSTLRKFIRHMAKHHEDIQPRKDGGAETQKMVTEPGSSYWPSSWIASSSSSSTMPPPPSSTTPP
jgi:hypothetical protein